MQNPTTEVAPLDALWLKQFPRPSHHYVQRVWAERFTPDRREWYRAQPFTPALMAMLDREVLAQLTVMGREEEDERRARRTANQLRQGGHG